MRVCTYFSLPERLELSRDEIKEFASNIEGLLDAEIERNMELVPTADFEMERRIHISYYPEGEIKYLAEDVVYYEENYGGKKRVRVGMLSCSQEISLKSPD